MIAGGADFASDVPVAISRKLTQALLKASKAKDLRGRINAFRALGLKDLLPVPPALKEASTGLTMGESAEKMAKENGITRGAQDELAHRSHTRAAAAWASGKFSSEVMTVFASPDFTRAGSEDNTVRKNSDMAAYAKLPPIFDRKHGTVSAANSSPLTDGAAAVILMSEERAKSLNGGSIALGHPFAATAARMVTQTLHELARRDQQTELVTLCAAGGLGAAAVLERV